MRTSGEQHGRRRSEARRAPGAACALVASLFVAGAGGCGEAGAPQDDAPPPVFIALQRDFADFRAWPRTDLGSIALAGHPPGPRAAYVNHALPAGATAYPVGTIIVKAITAHPDDPASWALFAMVKRGGGFNADGARDWEFFTLRIVGDTPVILGRGLNPPSDGDGDPYHATDGIGCNACHGTEDARAGDSILSPALRPGG